MAARITLHSPRLAADCSSRSTSDRTLRGAPSAGEPAPSQADRLPGHLLRQFSWVVVVQDVWLVIWQKAHRFLDSSQIAWFGGPMTPEEQLRKVSLRVTRPRVAVLTEVNAHPHANVDTLTAKVRARLGSVSTQAVYDVLRALADAELIRRIEPAGSPARFESRVGDNHHHAVCRTCGDVADVDCATGSAPCLEASNTNGFIIDEAEVTSWGICPACQHNTSDIHPETARSNEGES